MKGKIVFIVLGLIVGFFFIGFLTGRMLSPDSDDSVNAMKFINKNLQYDQEPEGKLLRVTCGVQSYRYYPALDSIAMVYVSPDEIEQLKTKRQFLNTQNMKEFVFALFGGGPSIVILGTKLNDYITPLTSSAKIKYGLAAALGIVSGFFIGYSLGYDDYPDCDAEKVVQCLNDKQMWRAYAKQYQRRTSILESLKIPTKSE